MLEREMLVRSVCLIADEVFSTMLGLTIALEEAYADRNTANPSNGVVSLIGLTGKWVGTGCIHCSAEFARKICAHLLQAEYEEMNDEVLDAVAEVTNMIIGGFKTALEEHLGPMGMSTPTVVYGQSFAAHSASPSEWTIVRFRCGEDRMEVRFCLAPAAIP